MLQFVKIVVLTPNRPKNSPEFLEREGEDLTERGSGTDEHPADVGEAEEGEVVGMVGGDGGYPPSLPESEAEGAVALAGGTVLLVGAESRGGSGGCPRVEAELAAAANIIS